MRHFRPKIQTLFQIQGFYYLSFTVVPFREVKRPRR